MPLPRIEAITPVILPPTDQKEYPDLFISYLRMIRLSGTEMKLDMQLSPYNWDTSEFGPGNGVNFSIKDVFAEAARVPLLGHVMGGIVQLSGLLLKEKDLISKIALASEEDKPALQTELDAVRTALGM
jgi:hypothetical protein